MCEKGKIPSGTSLGQMSKQLSAGVIKPELGFCGSGFGFFQSVRFLFSWIRERERLHKNLNLFFPNGSQASKV